MPPLRRRGLVCTLALACATLHAPTPVHAQTPGPGTLAASVDSIAAAALRDGRTAGRSVAVVRGRDTLVLKGYGFADLEFDVPTPPQAVYEIGSVTKQFTAAAILQLQERGVAADSAGHLTLRSGTGTATRLAYHGDETFGTGQTRLIFVRDKGRVTRLRLDSVSGYAVLTRAP